MVTNEEAYDRAARIAGHLSNERTFLSWLRTSIGIMAFGFVIERFALISQQIALVAGKENSAKYTTAFQAHSIVLGEVLIGLGLLVCVLALVSFNKVRRQIEENKYQPSMIFVMFVGFTIIVIGLGLVFYLNNTATNSTLSIPI